MTKKKPGNTYPLCDLCGEEYDAYGAAGKSKHWKEVHPKEWAEYKEKVILPNLKKAIKTRSDEAQKRKRKSRKQVPEESPSEGEEQGEMQEDGQGQPEVPQTYPSEPLPKPAAGAMPQQILTMSGRIPPADNGFEMEVENLDAPNSDVKTGSTTIKPVRTNNFLEANVFAFTPKVFQFSSNLIHTMWQVTVEQWGWDPNMTMGQWLDTYFYMTAERLGIRLRTYEVLPQGGNGDGDKQQPERTPVHATNEGLSAADFWSRQGSG